jgi:hypothetical protein
LAQALAHGDINPDVLNLASQQIIDLLYATEQSGEPPTAALTRLSVQYAQEIASLGAGSINANAFLNAILALEKAAGLGERDKMEIYGIVTKDGDLAGAGIFAFLGFFDILYRDHDYDWGRTVAQRLLANSEFNQPGQLGPIRYTPTRIRTIDPSLTGLHLKNVARSDVSTFEHGLTTRINQVIKDALPNPLVRFPTQLGADLILKLLLDIVFSSPKGVTGGSKVKPRIADANTKSPSAHTDRVNHPFWKHRITLSTLILLLLLLPLAFTVASRIRHPVVILDPVGVPKQFADAGFSTEMITGRVKDRLQAIQRTQETATTKEDLGDSDIPLFDKVEIPDTGISPSSHLGFAPFVAR